MSTNKKEEGKCAICGAPTEKVCGWYNGMCPKHEQVGHIVFTSVVDGASSARNASLDDLVLALRYEMKHNNRSSLTKAISREINKKTKAAERHQ